MGAEGPDPLVLLPGLGCDARLFAPQIEGLSSRRPIMIVPLTVGDTVETMAAAILPHLPPRFALCGHGLGGAVALQLLHRASGRVARLALISAYALAEPPAMAAEREPRIMWARAGRLRDAVEADVPATALAAGPGRSAVRALLGGMVETLGAEAYARQVRALQRRPDSQGVLRRAACPVLILAGEADTLVPLRRQQVMAELARPARLVVLSQAGHLPTLEAPEAATAALDQWLGWPLPLH